MRLIIENSDRGGGTGYAEGPNDQFVICRNAHPSSTYRRTSRTIRAVQKGNAEGDGRLEDVANPVSPTFDGPAPKTEPETGPRAAPKTASSGDLCQCEVTQPDGDKTWCWVDTAPHEQYCSTCWCSDPAASGHIVSEDCNK